MITSRHYDVEERMIEQDGKLIINRSQSAESMQQLVDENAAMAETSASSYGPAGFRLAGRIPLVVAEQWSMECGEAIGTKAFGEYVRRKLMDGDFAKLRVKGY
jgi:hypothetical protein